MTFRTQCELVIIIIINNNSRGCSITSPKSLGVLHQSFSVAKYNNPLLLCSPNGRIKPFSLVLQVELNNILIAAADFTENVRPFFCHT